LTVIYMSLLLLLSF